MNKPGRKKQKSDQWILKTIEQHRPEGWDVLFAKYDPLIKAITGWSKWNFTQEEQQDVSQNIRMSLQTAIPKFKQQSTLAWFIKRIATYQCIDELRRKNRRIEMVPATQYMEPDAWNSEALISTENDDPFHHTAQNERYHSVLSALRRLGDSCRESIQMFYISDLSYKQISDQLGVSVNTVGSRLSKCLTKLKKELQTPPLQEELLP